MNGGWRVLFCFLASFIVGVVMGVMSIDVVVEVPQDVVLKALVEVCREFFEKRPEYKKWYRVHMTGDGAVYEINAYGMRLKYEIGVEALNEGKSRVTISVQWSAIKNLLSFGLLKSQAKLGIDTTLLQLLSLEYGYREGLKAGKELGTDRNNI